MQVMPIHRCREKGNAIIGLALILPLVIFFMFTAYRLGVQTAFIPSVQLNMQALLNAQVNSSFISGAADPPAGAPPSAENGGPLLFVEGIKANLKQLINAAPKALGISAYNYSLFASAWSLDCSSDLEEPATDSLNPNLVESMTSSVPAAGNPAIPAEPSATIYNRQAKGCVEQFSNADVRLNYCYNPNNNFVCYGLTAYMENPPPKITEVSHFVIRSIVNDNICPQTDGSYSVTTLIQPPGTLPPPPTVTTSTAVTTTTTAPTTTTTAPPTTTTTTPPTTTTTAPPTTTTTTPPTTTTTAPTTTTTTTPPTTTTTAPPTTTTTTAPPVLGAGCCNTDNNSCCPPCGGICVLGAGASKIDCQCQPDCGGGPVDCSDDDGDPSTPEACICAHIE